MEGQVGMDLGAALLPALRQLLPPGSRVLVAASGGPDSQALLDLVPSLAGELGLEAVFAAGVNHGLRPEAKRELDLAAALAASYGVPFARLTVEVERRGNLLDSARRARYRALFAHADTLGVNRIAVAHNANDQAETVLFNLVRGAGLRGAAGIRPQRGRVVRPLLTATREQILAYLEARQIAYACDPSNEDPRRMRARLRAQVLPALTAINSAAVVNVARFAARARRDEDFLSRLARSRRRRAEPSSLVGLISADPHKAPGLPEQAAPLAVTLAKGALGSRVLRLWLAEQGVRADSRELDRLLALRREGASIVVEGRCVMLSRGCYWVTRGRPYEIELSPPGRAELPGLPLAIVSRFTEAGAFDVQRACSATRVAFDADRLHLSVWVRSVRCGDRVRPFGLQGSAKVGNLFTNAKIPQPLREHWPVLAHGDEIAWVVGLRRGDLAPVTATTRRLLVLELEGMVP